MRLLRSPVVHALALIPLVAAVYLYLAGRDDPSASRHYSQGLLLSQEAQWSAAISEFDAAIRLDPEMAQAYAGRGVALVRLARFPEAQADLSRALQLDGQLRQAYAYRITTDMATGHLELAVTDLERFRTLPAAGEQ